MDRMTHCPAQGRSSAFTFLEIIIAMAVLAVVVLADMLHKWIGYLRGTRPMTLSEVGLPDAPAPR